MAFRRQLSAIFISLVCLALLFSLHSDWNLLRSDDIRRHEINSFAAPRRFEPPAESGPSPVFEPLPDSPRSDITMNKDLDMTITANDSEVEADLIAPSDITMNQDLTIKAKDSEVEADLMAQNLAKKREKSKRLYQQFVNRRAIVAEAMANYSRPPYESLVNETTGEIVGDVDFLLDFAILGFGKCGTTSLMYWLERHPQVQTFDYEVYDLTMAQPARLVDRLYHELRNGPYLRGYKSPGDIRAMHVLNYYRQYWPRTKFIIGIRHPVRLFESLYNFRVQNMKPNSTMPHPNNLIGRCIRGTMNTCTDKALFAYYLLNLGKTNHPTPRPPNPLERKIINVYPRTPVDVEAISYMPNPVFLFDLEQLADGNETRTQLFRIDFQQFMGLEDDLADLMPQKPGRTWEDHIQQHKDRLKMDICQEEYRPVRTVLMNMAQLNSLWLRQVFLSCPDVVVSSREYLEKILETYMLDPCEGGETDQ